jgi:hypothetical protein
MARPGRTSVVGRIVGAQHEPDQSPAAPPAVDSARVAEAHRPRGQLGPQPTRLLPRPSGRHRPSNVLRWARWPISSAWLREWWVTLIGVAAIVVTVLTITIWFTVRDARAPAPTSADPTTAATPAVGGQLPDPRDSPDPAAAQSPSTATQTPSRASANTPITQLARFATAVHQQIAIGNLDPDAGHDLLQTLSDIATRLQRGQDRKAAGQLRGLNRRLEELRRDGKLTQPGFDTLSALVPTVPERT